MQPFMSHLYLSCCWKAAEHHNFNEYLFSLEAFCHNEGFIVVCRQMTQIWVSEVGLKRYFSCFSFMFCVCGYIEEHREYRVNLSIAP